MSATPLAAFRGVTARDLQEVTDDPAVLERGRWAVCVTFEGQATFARFASWTPEPPRDDEVGDWAGPEPGAWTSTMTQHEYTAGVAHIRERIAAGDVYQANLCRVLSAPAGRTAALDPAALAVRLAGGNPAPYGGFLRLPGLAIVSASPELYLRRRGGAVTSGPVKGTAPTAAGLTAKDRAENVMIVDLVRNDLSRVCRPGTVTVPRLLTVEAHPGLVHLASYVSGELHGGVGWREILTATFPPGSVTGAPKLAALDVIAEIEPGPRGPYCGAFGWIDGDAAEAELAVAIRTFWVEGDTVRFGTGAGITWGSDPAAEWAETELKAARLVRLAQGTDEGGST